MMNPWEYPIDAKTLLRKKIALKRELLAQDRAWTEQKIAILGGSSTQELAAQMELFLLSHGLRPVFYQSAYGQYWQEAVFENPALRDFQPDVLYIHTSWRNIEAFPARDGGAAEEALAREYGRFQGMWDALRERYACPIIQNNFDRPDYRLLGNRDIWDERGRSGFIARLNQQFYAYAREQEDFYINDIDYLSAEFGLSAWGNPLYWHLYKLSCCMEAIPSVAQSVANIIKSLRGKNKKLIAVDLDNTLWKGEVGESGPEGIEIGPDTAAGEVYAAFQSYLKQLKETGVVLAVNSKNDEKNALAGLARPEGVLRKEDFVSIKANWEPKDQNLLAIARELSLGTDSFVFLDDNPAERALVASSFPETAVPNLEQPEQFIGVLDHSGFFEVTKTSAEDRTRTEQYHIRAEAERARSAFPSYGDYLKSLQMKASIRAFEPSCFQRIAQLANKSNQFHLTARRYTESEIAAAAADPNQITLYGKLEDRFGASGLVSAIIGRVENGVCHIDLWVMSCRVLKRELEYAMLDALISRCISKNILELRGYYFPTAKNGMVREFYPSLGFRRTAEENGATEWTLSLREPYMPKNRFIAVEL